MSRLLSDPDSWPGANLLCWVLMPDHWHGLAALDGASTLATVMNRAKGRSAYGFNQAMGRTGRVWAPGFHDRALRRQEDILPTARYIIANPLRAGLADAVGNYPYWDAKWLSDPTIL